MTLTRHDVQRDAQLLHHLANISKALDSIARSLEHLTAQDGDDAAPQQDS
jgi:hypothetical protein